VSWWLTSDHVKRTISSDQAPESFGHDDISIEIPGDINSLQQQDPRTALKWREETRAAFTEAIRKGYKVIGFTREKDMGRYLLRRGSQEPQISQIPQMVSDGFSRLRILPKRVPDESVEICVICGSFALDAIAV